MRRAAPTLVLALLLGGACDGGGGEADEGAGGEEPRVETGGAGTLDGNDLVDANVTTDTQTLPMPDSAAAARPTY